MKKEQNKLAEARLNRRTAIGTGIAAGLAASSSLTALGNDKRSRSRSRTTGFSGPTVSGSVAHSLPEDHWANLVEQSFRVVGLSYDPSGTSFRRTKIELVDTAKLTFANDDARPEIFKPEATLLLFKGPSHFKLSDASYRLYHPWLGEFNLLLSYTKDDRFENDNVYNAVLNN